MRKIIGIMIGVGLIFGLYGSLKAHCAEHAAAQQMIVSQTEKPEPVEKPKTEKPAPPKVVEKIKIEGEGIIIIRGRGEFSIRGANYDVWIKGEEVSIDTKAKREERDSWALLPKCKDISTIKGKKLVIGIYAKEKVVIKGKGDGVIDFAGVGTVEIGKKIKIDKFNRPIPFGRAKRFLKRKLEKRKLRKGKK